MPFSETLSQAFQYFFRNLNAANSFTCSVFLLLMNWGGGSMFLKLHSEDHLYLNHWGSLLHMQMPGPGLYLPEY